MIKVHCINLIGPDGHRVSISGNNIWEESGTYTKKWAKDSPKCVRVPYTVVFKDSTQISGVWSSYENSLDDGSLLKYIRQVLEHKSGLYRPKWIPKRIYFWYIDSSIVKANFCSEMLENYELPK